MMATFGVFNACRAFVLPLAACLLLFPFASADGAEPPANPCEALTSQALKTRASGVKAASPSANAVLGQELVGQDATPDLLAKIAACRLHAAGALDEDTFKVRKFHQDATEYVVSVEQQVRKYLSLTLKGITVPSDQPCSVDYAPPILGWSVQSDQRRCSMSADLANTAALADSAYTTARSRQFATVAKEELTKQLTVFITDAVMGGWKPTPAATALSKKVDEFLQGPGQSIKQRLIDSVNVTSWEANTRKSASAITSQAETLITETLQRVLSGKVRSGKREEALKFLDASAAYIDESLKRASASEKLIKDASVAADLLAKGLSTRDWKDPGSRLTLDVVRDIADLRIPNERILKAALADTSLGAEDKKKLNSALRSVKQQVDIARFSSTLDDVAAYANFANSVGLKIDMKNLQRNIDGTKKALSVVSSFAAGNYLGAVSGAMGMFGGGSGLGGDGSDPAIRQQLGEILRLQQLTLQKLDDLSSQLDRATEQIMARLDAMNDVLTYVAALAQNQAFGKSFEACRTFVDTALQKSVAKDGVFRTYGDREEFFRRQQGEGSPHTFGTCYEFLLSGFRVVPSRGLVEPGLWDFRHGYTRGSVGPGNSPFMYDKTVYFPMVTLTVHLLEMDKRTVVDAPHPSVRPTSTELVRPTAAELKKPEYDPVNRWYRSVSLPRDKRGMAETPGQLEGPAVHPAVKIPPNCGRNVVAILASAPASLIDLIAAKRPIKCVKDDPDGGALVVGRIQAMGPHNEGLEVQFQDLTEMPIHTDYIARLATYSLFLEPYVGLLSGKTGSGVLSSNYATLVPESEWTPNYRLDTVRIANFHEQLLRGVDVINLAIAQQVLVSGALIAQPAAQVLLNRLFGQKPPTPAAGVTPIPGGVLKKQLEKHSCASDMFQYESDPYGVVTCMLKSRGATSAFARNVALALVAEGSKKEGGGSRISDRGQYEALLRENETVAKNTPLFHPRLARFLSREEGPEGRLGIRIRTSSDGKEDFFLPLPDADDVWQWRLAREAATDSLVELRQRTLERVISAGYRTDEVGEIRNADRMTPVHVANWQLVTMPGEPRLNPTR